LICFVIFIAMVNGMAAAYLRRRIRKTETDIETKAWRAQIFVAAGRPLYLLIWIYGVYLAATPLLLKLPDSTPPPLARQLFDKSFQFGVFIAVFWFLFRFTRVLELMLSTWTGKTQSKMDDLIVPLVCRSLRVVVPVMGILVMLPLLQLPSKYSALLGKGGSILIIGMVAWILCQAVGLIEKAVQAKYDITASDNLQARKVFTQVHVISKTLYFGIAILAVASTLMLFEEVRRFGTSILASAGVLGIVVGFAAQRTIANLFAGFQLAMTQPIRMDDVVIVEGEWGRIEEFTLTYVVVRVWDERRLIVPLSHFIEKPFQNWTRVSAELLGSVFVWADYSVPVAELRPAIQRIVEGCIDWDHRFWNLQVTETTDRAVQLRVLATAEDSSKAWNLRCEIREKLITLLQEKYPECLPRFRANLAGGGSLPN